MTIMPGKLEPRSFGTQAELGQNALQILHAFSYARPEQRRSPHSLQVVHADISGYIHALDKLVNTSKPWDYAVRKELA